MVNLFKNVLSSFIKSHGEDLTNENKLTCDMGYLVPILCDDILPGDNIKLRPDILIRLAPMLAPVMHQVDAFVHYWFVPNRLCWKNWENFITGGEDGLDASVKPTIDFSAGCRPGTLGDYLLGIPEKVNEGAGKVDAMPFRAYNLIYNNWYRDENLIDPVAVSLEDGNDTTTNTTLLRRAWEKDYFTSALPWPQKGPEVVLPLGTTAPVKSNSGTVDTSELININQFNINGTQYIPSSNVYTGVNTSGNNIASGGGVSASQELRQSLYTDLSDANSASVRQIRTAFQTQKWLERNARAGSRYVESLLAHFGVRSPDARLQLPEYIGGSRQNIIFSEVLQTSATGDTGTPQANMAGHGFTALDSRTIRYHATEHGFLIGILSVMPRTSYQQGISRKWTRETKFDYAWNEFAHIGEQAVLNKEIYANSTDPNGVFGYQGRYQEYRQRPSEVHGDFKNSLNFWHLGRIFDDSTPPTLNQSFIECVPSKRIFAVEDQSLNSLWVQIAHHYYSWRKLPKRGEPGFIDHN